MQLEDFALVNQSGTYDRRDMVSDVDMHREMIEAMVSVMHLILQLRIYIVKRSTNFTLTHIFLFHPFTPLPLP